MKHAELLELLTDILNAIYWSKFTANQSTVIIGIIENSELPDAMSKANEICEFLGIEKRGNRRAISELLS